MKTTHQLKNEVTQQIENGEYNKAFKLHQNGQIIEWDKCITNGMNPATNAVLNNKIHDAKILVSLGCSIEWDKCITNGMNPATNAVLNNRIASAKQLQELGCPIEWDKCTINGMNPAARAILDLDASAAKLLLNLGCPSIQWKIFKKNHMNLATQAIKDNQVSYAKKLLELGCPSIQWKKLKQIYGMNPATRAIVTNDIDDSIKLIELGCPSIEWDKLQNEKGENCTTKAILDNDLEKAKVFIELGCPLQWQFIKATELSDRHSYFIKLFLDPTEEQKFSIQNALTIIISNYQAKAPSKSTSIMIDVDFWTNAILQDSREVRDAYRQLGSALMKAIKKEGLVKQEFPLELGLQYITGLDNLQLNSLSTFSFAQYSAINKIFNPKFLPQDITLPYDIIVVITKFLSAPENYKIATVLQKNSRFENQYQIDLKKSRRFDQNEGEQSEKKLEVSFITPSESFEHSEGQGAGCEGAHNYLTIVAEDDVTLAGHSHNNSSGSELRPGDF